MLCNVGNVSEMLPEMTFSLNTTAFWLAKMSSDLIQNVYRSDPELIQNRSRTDPEHQIVLDHSGSDDPGIGQMIQIENVCPGLP